VIAVLPRHFQYQGLGVGLGAAFTAWTLGFRHAFDADHIAAIDNATRKLIELDRPAAMTGLWFSLGHASVVVLASIAIAMAAADLRDRLASLLPWADALATGFSALCLFALAVANAVVLVAICRIFAATRRGGSAAEPELRRLLAKRGLLGRALRRVFGLITRSRQMYLIGLLFGLGFDTATEIGVLGMSAAEGSHGLPLSAILVFPGLFAAGMALVDTLDGIMMAGAYGWASANPVRRLSYNIAVTLVSVVVAVAIGGIELFGLYGGAEDGASGFWRLAGYFNDHSSAIGASVVALFGVSWFAAVLISRGQSGLPKRG
jgi:high-affinity nickel-transport protein